MAFYGPKRALENSQSHEFYPKGAIMPMRLIISSALVIWVPSLGFACTNTTALDRIIYIGDSHSAGEFGDALEKSLAADPQIGSENVKRYGVSGSSANNWALPISNREGL